MANRNQKSVELFITKAPQPTLNTLSETATDYVRFKTEPFDIPVPQNDFNSDQGMVGDGVGYSQNEVVYNWLPSTLTIRGRLDDNVFPLLYARCLGGPVVDTTVTATTSYDHTIPMATELELVQPKLSSVIVKGQADFIYGDMYIQSISISQQGKEVPRYEAVLSNTGLFKRLADSAIVLSGIAATPANWLGAGYHGGATTLVYNDGGAQDLTASRGLISVNVNITQPVEAIGLAGDSFLTAGDVSTGSIIGTLMRQTQDQNIVSMRVYTQSALGQWVNMKNGTILTNLIVKFKGKKIGASTDSYETETKLTRAQITAVTGATEGEYEALDVTIKALPDTTTKRLCVGRVRNGTATLT